MKKSEIIAKIKGGDMDKLSFEELLRARNLPELSDWKDKIFALMQRKLDEEKASQGKPNQNNAPAPVEKPLTDNEIDESWLYLQRLEQSTAFKLSPELGRAQNCLYAQREDGAEVNAYQEIREIAHMSVAVDNIGQTKKMKQEDYNRAVEEEIKTLIKTIFTVSENPDHKSPAEADNDAKKHEELYKGNRVSIDAKRVGNVLSAKMGDITSKLEQFKHTQFGEDIKRRVNSVDSRLSAKLGKAYTTRFIPAPEPEVRYVEKLVEKIVEVPAKVEAPAVEPLRRDVFFKINSFKISNDEQQKVKEIADYMQKNPNSKVVVTGYADAGTGNDRINDRLAAQRAEVRLWYQPCPY